MYSSRAWSQQAACPDRLFPGSRGNTPRDRSLPARAAAHFSPQAEAHPAVIVFAQLKGEPRNLGKPAGLVQAYAESGFRRHRPPHQSPQDFRGHWNAAVANRKLDGVVATEARAYGHGFIEPALSQRVLQQVVARAIEKLFRQH